MFRQPIEGGGGGVTIFTGGFDKTECLKDDYLDNNQTILKEMSTTKR